jgi:hypothetical protein
MAAKRKRPCIVAVQLNEQEKKELQQAAANVGVALSVFLRMHALVSVRAGDVTSGPPRRP